MLQKGDMKNVKLLFCLCFLVLSCLLVFITCHFACFKLSSRRTPMCPTSWGSSRSLVAGQCQDIGYSNSVSQNVNRMSTYQYHFKIYQTYLKNSQNISTFQSCTVQPFQLLYCHSKRVWLRRPLSSAVQLLLSAALGQSGHNLIPSARMAKFSKAKFSHSDRRQYISYMQPSCDLADRPNHNPHHSHCLQLYRPDAFVRFWKFFIVVHAENQKPSHCPLLPIQNSAWRLPPAVCLKICGPKKLNLAIRYTMYRCMLIQYSSMFSFRGHLSFTEIVIFKVGKTGMRNLRYPIWPPDLWRSWRPALTLKILIGVQLQLCLRVLIKGREKRRKTLKHPRSQMEKCWVPKPWPFHLT